MKKAYVGVYGCQMNISDAERMMGALAAIGYERTEMPEEADLILLNTCCVREGAEDRIYGKIGEIKGLKRKNPKLIFGISGCMAQKEGERLIGRAKHIDFVLGTNRLQELPRIVKEIEKEHSHVVDVSMEGLEFGETPLRQGKVFAWVPIMQGCDNFCTYCIVPYVRGREKSRPMEEILQEVTLAAQKGYKEVTLLGQNVNSYGKDLNGTSFAKLLEEVDKVRGIMRVRFMTSHPKDLSDEVIEKIATGKNICEHIHLPVQHGSNQILKKMNRGYTVEEYLKLTEKIRRSIPQISLTTDFIVGFPGETEEDFQNTLDFVKEVRFDAAFTFIYSPRSGTPAAKMEGQVEDPLKKDRLSRLMETQNAISLEINQTYQSQNAEVLVEGPSKNDGNMWSGRTRSNKLVLWPHKNEVPGDILNVKITSTQTFLLKGELST